MSAWDDICQVIEDECGKDVAHRVVLKLRKRVGGLRIYIPSRPSPKVTHKDTPQTLQKKHGISRATAYNWLNKYRI